MKKKNILNYMLRIETIIFITSINFFQYISIFPLHIVKLLAHLTSFLRPFLIHSFITDNTRLTRTEVNKYIA